LRKGDLTGRISRATIQTVILRLILNMSARIIHKKARRGASPPGGR
jgi:hypothetical protein